MQEVTDHKGIYSIDEDSNNKKLQLVPVEVFEEELQQILS